MASISPSHFGFETDGASKDAAASRPARRLLPSGTLSALITLGGFALCMAGGGWKAGAFNMLPRDDGIFTSAVFVAWTLLGHGFKEWVALLIASPVLAFTCYAFFHGHDAPLALFGAELAFIGGFGLILQRWKAYWASARTL